MLYIFLRRSKARRAAEEGNEEGENDKRAEEEKKCVVDTKLQSKGVKYSYDFSMERIHFADEWLLKACQWLEATPFGNLFDDAGDVPALGLSEMRCAGVETFERSVDLPKNASGSGEACVGSSRIY